MEAIKNGLCKNLTPAQLWSGARFFLLLNLGLIIYAVALNFYCAPNHFVFGGTTGLSVVLATCFPALSVSTFMWITNAVLDVLGCVFLGIKTMGWTLYSSFMLSFYSSMCEKLFPVSQPLTDDTLLELCFAVALPALASGIVFNIGASTGGTEIVAMILRCCSAISARCCLRLTSTARRPGCTACWDSSGAAPSWIPPSRA